MERRLQLLLDHERYNRVASVAERDGRSVASVIRAAIDVAYPSRDTERRTALQRVLTLAAERPDTGQPEEWKDVKAAMDDELSSQLNQWS